jgi:hypothetical protein
MSKRALSVSLLTAGLSAGLLAGAISPAAAQGHPVGGEGNVYFLSGAINESGQAAKIYAFGERGDEILYGDWDGDGIDSPMARRGNVYFVADQHTMATQDVFVYGNPDDKVLVGDWDGNGEDSIAVRRGNHFFVKNDNQTTGKADSEFHYGDAGDTVLVGNWDGASKKKDKNGNHLVNKDGVGQYQDADGKWHNRADSTSFTTDTLIVQRGNQFFVKNDTETGVADYTFYFGDAGDEIIVGDWATRAHTDSKKAFHNPDDANGADQLAVRRGLEYHQSSELAAAHEDKKNPSTQHVFYYGNPDDTVFVASRPGMATGQLHFLNTDTAKVTVEGAPAGIAYDSKGTPLVAGYTAANSGTATVINAGVRPAANLTSATVTAYNRDGAPVKVAPNEWFTSGALGTDPGTLAAAPLTNEDYLFTAEGLPLLSAAPNGVTAADVAPKTEAQLKASIVAASALAGAEDAIRPSLGSDLKVTRTSTPDTLGFLVFNRHGDEIMDIKARWAVSGDGFGVRR